MLKLQQQCACLCCLSGFVEEDVFFRVLSSKAQSSPGLVELFPRGERGESGEALFLLNMKAVF